MTSLGQTRANKSPRGGSPLEGNWKAWWIVGAEAEPRERRIEHRVEGGDGIGSGEGRGRERKKFETAARRKWVWCGGSKDRSRWEIDPDNSARWL